MACFIILAYLSADVGWHSGSTDDRNGKDKVALWSLVHGYAQLVTMGRFKKGNEKSLSILDILPTVESGSGR